MRWLSCKASNENRRSVKKLDIAGFGTGRNGVANNSFTIGAKFGTEIKVCQRMQNVTALEHKSSRIQSIKDTLFFWKRTDENTSSLQPGYSSTRNGIRYCLFKSVFMQDRKSFNFIVAKN
jgi:hypothetical protein